LAEDLRQDAIDLLSELKAKYGAHPALVAYDARLSPRDEHGTQCASVAPFTATPEAAHELFARLLSDEDADLALAGLEDPSAPLVSLRPPAPETSQVQSLPRPQLDDDDDYLAAIFSQPHQAAKTSATQGGIAKVSERDPQALYDLALAYREMGMSQAAIEALESCALAPAWRARAQIALAEVQRVAGDGERALLAADAAAQAAASQDEREAARYEVAMAQLLLGRLTEAAASFAQLPDAWRDVAARKRSLASGRSADSLRT
jgi:tetratricopeptide (TPR) repeat protein